MREAKSGATHRADQSKGIDDTIVRINSLSAWCASPTGSGSNDQAFSANWLLRPESECKALAAIIARKDVVAVNEHERPVVTEANEEAVRAGHTGDHLRYALIGSCALAILAGILVALFVKP